MTRWGLVATILAEPADILRFAAYHLDAGAHRLYIYLDAPSDAYDLLKAHPKIRPTICDAAHWKKLIGKRPPKHQVRQSLNATHAYNRRAEVDWLIHIDADEFLVPAQPIADALATLPADTTSARVRPMEQLAGAPDVFKAFIPPDENRDPLVRRLYPNYGAHLKGGFLSHVAGKLFVRSGMPDITLRIHNAFEGDAMLPRAAELVQIDLAHAHAKSWDDWYAHFRYRLEQGSYRPELTRDDGALSMHELFSFIEAEEGEAGLRAFYAEVAEDSADLRARLDAEGLLRIHDLDLGTKLTQHFPDFKG
ncbi:MAG: glycosyltransferase family 2 protein [Pseudomonadota bacterium]